MENLGLIQGSGWLFRNIDLHVGARDRLALIGRNGAGKTTLLKLIAGRIDADEGRRTIVPGTRVILLEQEPDLSRFATLLDYTLAGADAPARHEVEAIADQIGIDLSRAAASASGGERRRAQIARALAQSPDVLLLDEPTNHLDLAAIEWLEDWLKRFTGAFVVISHDRTFLTRLTRSTLWLDRGALRRHDVGFGGFDAWTEAVYAEEARAAQKLDAKLKLEEHWLLRGVTGRRRRNQGRLTKLHEMRAERAAMMGPQGAANLTIGTDDVRTKTVIDAKHVTKRYPGSGGERTVIRDFTLRVTRGDRIGIVGANGAGKSTLLKLIAGSAEPDNGTVAVGGSVKMGYFAQHAMDLLDGERTVFQQLEDTFPQAGQGSLRALAGCFGFSGDDIEKRCRVLSGGEKARLVMAIMLFDPPNFLVLDEPTNHLDMATKEMLIAALADYEGTMLFVSHDRHFLAALSNRVLELTPDGIHQYGGGYTEYVARTGQEAPGLRS